MEWCRDKENRERESRFKYFDFLIGVFVTPVAIHSFCKTIINETPSLPLYAQLGFAAFGLLYVTRQYHVVKIKKKKQKTHKNNVYNNYLSP